MAYNKAFGKTVKSAGKSESRRDAKDKKDSPLNFDWGGALDYAQTGLTAAGMVPGLGNLADLANVAVSGGRAAYAKATGNDADAKKHAAALAINAAAAIPGAGLAVGAGKLAKAGLTAAKGAKTLDKVADSAKLVKKGVEAKTKAKTALDATKALATKGKDYVKQSVKDAGKGLKGQKGSFKEYYGGKTLGGAVVKAGAKKGVKKVEKETVKSYAKSEIKKNEKEAKEKNLATKNEAKKQNIA